MSSQKILPYFNPCYTDDDDDADDDDDDDDDDHHHHHHRITFSHRMDGFMIN